MTFDPQMYDILDTEEDADEEPETCRYCDEPTYDDGVYGDVMCLAHIEEAIQEEIADARWERSRDGW